MIARRRMLGRSRSLVRRGSARFPGLAGLAEFAALGSAVSWPDRPFRRPFSCTINRRRALRVCIDRDRLAPKPPASRITHQSTFLQASTWRIAPLRMESLEAVAPQAWTKLAPLHDWQWLWWLRGTHPSHPPEERAASPGPAERLSAGRLVLRRYRARAVSGARQALRSRVGQAVRSRYPDGR